MDNNQDLHSVVHLYQMRPSRHKMWPANIFFFFCCILTSLQANIFLSQSISFITKGTWVHIYNLQPWQEEHTESTFITPQGPYLWLSQMMRFRIFQLTLTFLSLIKCISQWKWNAGFCLDVIFKNSHLKYQYCNCTNLTKTKFENLYNHDVPTVLNLYVNCRNCH